MKLWEMIKALFMRGNVYEVLPPPTTIQYRNAQNRSDWMRKFYEFEGR
jgi:hypothetical protein